MSNDLYIHSVRVPSTGAAPVRKPIHHILTIDCSGSMTGDLPRMRKQLCEKLVTLLHESDLLTLIWFSGKTEAGVVFEGREVPNLRDLEETRKIIDRWLKPIGLTSFKKPLVEARKAIERVGKAHPDHLHNFFFMTDGVETDR